MLPPAPIGAGGGAAVAKRGLQAGSLPRPLVGIEGGPAASDDALADVAVSLPLDWAGLLAALPRLAARATSAPWTAMSAVSPFAAALNALVPAMRPPRRAGEADGRGAVDAGALPAGEALRCCGGRVSAVLSTVLEAFAHCLAEGGPLSTDAPMTAPTTACFARARQAQLACLERVCELLGAKVVLVDLQVHPVMASDGA
jgi:hypothetical protein